MGKWHKGRIRSFFRDGKRKVDLQLKQLADSGRPLDISLTNDFAFKKTFRNKIALTGLLSSLAGEITSLEFPDTFLHGEYAEDREGILDVKVRLNHCKKVNIEIQLLSHPFWEERSLFYISRMYTEDFLKGQNYDALEECIHISILGFPRKGTEHFYSVIRLMDDKTGRVYSGKISLRVLYLSQLVSCSEEEKQTEVYHWAKLISARDWEVLKDMAKRNRYMKEAVEELERLNADKELRYLYLERLKAASDEATMQSYYKRLAEDAQKNGLAQGLEQGLSQGIKALIKDNLEEGKDKKVILTKLEKHFSLTEKEAQAYFDMYNNMS
jgi:predicted transposase/invertase (TIGR01784 family)